MTLTPELVALLDETEVANETGGVCTAILGPVPIGVTWEIEHMVVSTDSSTPTVARVYEDTVGQDQLRSGSQAGNFDEADFSPPLRFHEGKQIVVQWTGASAGTVATVNAQGSVTRYARDGQQQRRALSGRIPGGR